MKLVHCGVQICIIIGVFVCLFVFSVTETGELKVSNPDCGFSSSFSSVTSCFVDFEAMLFGVYKCRIVISSWKIVIMMKILLISSN